MYLAMSFRARCEAFEGPPTNRTLLTQFERKYAANIMAALREEFETPRKRDAFFRTVQRWLRDARKAAEREYGSSIPKSVLSVSFYSQSGGTSNPVAVITEGRVDLRV